MSKPFRFWSHCVLVTTMAVLVTFNPAWAGRGLRGWLSKRWGGNHCSSACYQSVPSSCYQPCEVVQPSPICCDSYVVEAAAPSSCCSPEFSEVPLIIDQSHPPASSKPIELAPIIQAPPLTTPAPAPTQNTEKPSLDPALSHALEASPSDTPKVAPSIVEQPKVDPSVESNAADLQLSTPDAAVVAPELPPATDTTSSTEDIFGNTPSVEPSVPAQPAPIDAAAPTVNEIFGDPSSPTPAAPDAGDDLFDGAAASSAPAPSADPMPAEDLFGTPSRPLTPDSPASNDLFSPAPAPAETEPAPAAGDDLFGNPIPSQPEPAAPADDLFGPVEAPTQSAPTSGDDLFGPAQPEAAPESNSLDDLFGNPASKQEEIKPKAKSSDPFAEIFSQNDVRIWQDNTGNFSIEARLAEINVNFVRLLKSNGNFCKVPLNRLSPNDRQFVARIASMLPPGEVKLVSADRLEN